MFAESSLTLWCDSEAGAVILKITYGYNIEPHGEDPLVSLADLALQQFSNAIVPGAWMVDMIPARQSAILKLLFELP